MLYFDSTSQTVFKVFTFGLYTSSQSYTLLFNRVNNNLVLQTSIKRSWKWYLHHPLL